MTHEQRAYLAKDHMEKASELIDKLIVAGAKELDGARENIIDVIGLLDDTVMSLSSGIDSVVADYGGDSVTEPSASPGLMETVGPRSAAAPSVGGFILPATAVAGQPIKAKLPVVLTNGDAKIAGNFTVVLYADMSASLDGNQVQVAKVSGKAALKSGETKTFKLALKSLPASLSAGTHHLFAEAIDPNGATDVAVSGPLTVQVPTVTLSAVGDAVKPRSSLLPAR